MRKLALGIATVWLLLVALIVVAAFPAIARAADIPSSVSGTYAGSGVTAGWSCEIRAFQVFDGLGGSARALSAQCQTPEGHRSGAISTADPCPTEALQPPLPIVPILPATPGGTWGPGTPKLSILAYLPATPQCALGQIRVQITTATSHLTGPGLPGPESLMCRTQIVVPSAPYTGCGEPARLRFRVFGR